MDTSAIYEALSEIFREVFLQEIALRPDLTAEDVPGWDSFKQIEIILLVQERYGIKLHTRELDALHNVGDLAHAIENKIARLNP